MERRLTREERMRLEEIVKLLDEATSKIDEIYDRLAEMSKLMGDDTDGDVEEPITEKSLAYSAVMKAWREVADMGFALRRLRSLFEMVIRD